MPPHKPTAPPGRRPGQGEHQAHVRQIQNGSTTGPEEIVNERDWDHIDGIILRSPRAHGNKRVSAMHKTRGAHEADLTVVRQRLLVVGDIGVCRAVRVLAPIAGNVPRDR